jgi:hypothetical protein
MCERPLVADLTPPEERLVDRYVSVLDFISRCAQAVDEGNTYYLWEKTGQLASAVEALKVELDRTSGRPKVRRDVLAAAVRFHGRHYRAGRLLHPAQVELTASEIGSIVLAVAGADALAMNDAEYEAIGRDARTIAERTDLRREQVVRVLAALRRWEVRDAG